MQSNSVATWSNHQPGTCLHPHSRRGASQESYGCSVMFSFHGCERASSRSAAGFADLVGMVQRSSPDQQSPQHPAMETEQCHPCQEQAASLGTSCLFPSHLSCSARTFREDVHRYREMQPPQSVIHRASHTHGRTAQTQTHPDLSRAELNEVNEI